MKKLFVVLVSLVLFAGCSSISVQSDYDNSADFASYKSYSWYSGEVSDDILKQNPLVKKRIVESIDRALQAKGLSMGSSDSDLIAVVHAGSKERMQVTNYGGGYGGYGWYRPWGGYGGNYTDVSYYDEATLVIDLVDAKKEALVWRGMGTKTLSNNPSNEKMQKNIDDAVAKILAQYPPK